MNLNRVKQVLLVVLGIIIVIGFFILFFYAFIFLLVIGLLYLLYRKSKTLTIDKTC